MHEGDVAGELDRRLQRDPLAQDLIAEPDRPGGAAGADRTVVMERTRPYPGEIRDLYKRSPPSWQVTACHRLTAFTVRPPNGHKTVRFWWRRRS